MRKPALRSVGALLAGACLALAAPANAQVKTGDTIGKAEVDKVKDLVSPGVAFFINSLFDRSHDEYPGFPSRPNGPAGPSGPISPEPPRRD